MQPKPTLLQAVQYNLRLRQCSPRTEEAYLQWIRRLVRFHGRRHPRELGVIEIEAFLSHLAVAGRMESATVAQARAALLFLSRRVLALPLEGVEAIPAGRRPEVLTRGEGAAVLVRLEGVPKLVGLWLYGGGRRVREALTLGSRT